MADERETEEAAKFCFNSKYSPDSLLHEEIHELMADFAAEAVAKREREIAEELRGLMEEFKDDPKEAVEQIDIRLDNWEGKW